MGGVEKVGEAGVGGEGCAWVGEEEGEYGGGAVPCCALQHDAGLVAGIDTVVCEL